MTAKVYGLLLPLFALGMAGLGLYHVASSASAKSSVEPPSPPFQRSFGQMISARGLVEPNGELISVSSAVPGLVIEAFVSEEEVGKTVAQGEPLLKLDDRQLQAQLTLVKAQLEEAKANLARLKNLPRPEDVPPSVARVKQAEARWTSARDKHERTKKLVAGNVATDEELIDTKSAADAAEQQWNEAKAAHDLLLAGAWEKELAVASAACSTAEAEVKQIETEIERTLVRAPIHGQILQVNKRVGEYVQTLGNEALFVLGDCSKLRVRVEIDEEDVHRFRQQEIAKASPRGDFQRSLELKFVRVDPMVEIKRTWTGDNTERSDTRVLPVLFEVQGDTTNLYVGQQLDVHLPTDVSTGLAKSR